jgi:hypothetical protein
MNAFVHTINFPAFDAAGYDEAMTIATIRSSRR